jgi:poly(3-hydroxybutyrate) depolymerase
MYPALLLLAVVSVLAGTATSTDSSNSSAGCGTKPLKSLNKLHTATLMTSNRTYLYFLPETYNQDTPAPLVLSFHGGRQTAHRQANLDELTNPYFNTDHILIYPQALQTGKSITDRFWQGSPGSGDVDDISYVADILDAIEEEFCVDLTRIYATGKSEGGGLVGILACDYASSQRIAAFAPVSGAFYLGHTNCSDPSTVPISCNASRSDIPIMEFHGGNDTTISIHGGKRHGYCLPAIAHWIRAWGRRDNVNISELVVDDKSLSGSALIRRYGKGNKYGLITWVYNGDEAGHDWPATYPNRDNTVHGTALATFNASTMIMDWFASYTLP